jgi:AcrR family transcriptional regulator
MKTEKTDRRIKYTKMVLKQGLVELLKQKSINKITVKEICEKADINRATFYSHYLDQYDLLKQIEQELLLDINSYLESYSYQNNSTESLLTLQKIFEYIKENRELCTVLLSDNGDREFQKDVMLIVQKQFIQDWTTTKKIKEVDAECIYSFVTAGSIGFIQRWLQDGLKKSTKEMAEFHMKLVNHGLSSFI